MVRGRINKIKTRALVILLIVLILALIALIGFWFVNNKFSKLNYVEIKNIEINEGVSEQLEGYRNIALFGVDARANTYEDTRSDCIIIVSINEKTKDVNLVSVYRDTYVYIEGHGYDKVTHAYAYGGPELAINTLNKNLDLDISEFVAVNFDAVVEIIDAIDGVSVDVDSEEIKYINNYITALNQQLGKNAAEITKTGTQKLNGIQALSYSRIRYTSGGDYKRTERMREILNLVFEKAKKMSITKINNLADILLPEVYTNVEATEILSLASQMAQYNVSNSIGWPYEIKGITLNIWYGVPVTLESNVEKLHEAIFKDDDYKVTETVKKYSDDIIKKTGYKE